jgi:hypothetical protein
MDYQEQHKKQAPRKKTHIYSDSHARGKLPTKEVVSENGFSTVSIERLNCQVFNILGRNLEFSGLPYVMQGEQNPCVKVAY